MNTLLTRVVLGAWLLPIQVAAQDDPAVREIGRLKSDCRALLENSTPRRSINYFIRSSCSLGRPARSLPRPNVSTGCERP